jgi:hypothetical protein
MPASVKPFSVERQPFTASELLDIIENKATREPLRKYQPQHTRVFVNAGGVVQGIVRSRHALTLEQGAEASAMFPEAAWFMAEPGMYMASNALERRIRDCAEAFQSVEDRTGGGAWLKVDNEWVPSIGTVLLNKRKKGSDV